MEIQELELRDLPKADADELRAFVDKRRWFEARLKTLQGLPPIYPFVQLEQGNVNEPENVEWRLPSAEVLKQWRLERDRIELEVFAFDGGDLGRMKAKTREVTLIPLTPPSTHLISITLSTIVLVDKLLSLLRSRGETLELTAHRLEWDGLRTTVQAELQALVKEAKSLACDKARWRADEDAQKLEKGRRTSLLDSPGALKLKTTTVSSSSAATTGASVLQVAPSKSLQLPLLHSHITNLRIRHRTLKATTLARAGTVLDKMIDKAAGLRGLGGLHGPEADKKTGGALPDEFLDVQDALDEQAGALDGLIEVCEALEKQWREAARFQAACATVEDKAAQLLSEIISATTMDSLEVVRLKIESCKIPDSISTNLVMPNHADLPDLAEHNRSTLTAIESAREQCQKTLVKCKSTLDTRIALLRTRESLQSARSATREVQMEVDAMIEWLRSFPGRPDPSKLACLTDDANAWQEALSNQRASAEAVRVRTTKVAKQGVLALLRHKQTVTLPLEVVDQDLRQVVEEESDCLRSAVKNLIEELGAAEKEDHLLQQARKVSLAEQRIAKELQRLEEILFKAVAAAKWTDRPEATSMSPSADAVMAEVQSSGLALQKEVLAPLAAVNTDVIAYGVLRQHLLKTSQGLGLRQTSLKRLAGSLARLERQKVAMQKAAEMSDRLRSEISGLDASLIGISDSGLSEACGELQLSAVGKALEALQEEIRGFVDSLAEGIPLVASKPATDSPKPTANDSSVLPTTESPQPSPSSFDSINDPDGLGEVDDRVRAVVNEMAVRLGSGVDQVHTLHIAVKRKLYEQRQLAEAARQENDLVERIGRAGRFHRQRLQELDTATHGRDHLSEDLEALLGDAESDEHQFRKEGDQIDLLLRLQSGDASPSEARISQALATLARLVYEVRKAANAAQDRDQELANKDGAPSGDPPHASAFSPVNQLHSTSSEQAETFQPSLTSGSAVLEADSATSALRHPTSQTPPAEPHIRAISEADLPDLLPELRESDVFGPHVIRPPSERSPTITSGTFSINGDGISRQISLLRDRLDAVNLDTIVYPAPSALRSTPSLRRLPNEASAKRLKFALMNLSEEADDLVVADGHREWDEYVALCDAIKARVALLPQLDYLVAFASAAADCDAAMSALLQQVDAYKPGASAEQVTTSMDSADWTFERMEEAALMVESDSRVGQERRRLQTSWTDLQAVALQKLQPESEVHDSDGGVSVATSYSLSRSISTMSIASQPPKKIPFPSRLPKSQSTRTVSNPLSASVTASTEASRSRAVSDRPAVSGLPRFRKDPITLSTIPGTPTRKRVESTSSIPRPVRTLASSPAPLFGQSPLPSMRPLPKSVASPMLENKSRTLPRSRSKSGLDAIHRPRVSAGGKSTAPKVYVSNPKNKLDVAVGKIVNRLKVDIPIAPVGLDWQDESGKYWIGAEGRAKLCFCRILRSKTVMVRVGGGWAELSRFLLDHFADEMVQLPAALDLAVAALSPVNEPKLLPSTPAPVRHIAPGTPAHLSPSKSAEGGGSPLSLVAMQLIRKASESPPVREKERERMWSPRRSLLG